MSAWWGEWWGRVSSTLVGGGVAIGLVAIPTFIWLPREFDQIGAALDQVQQDSREATEASKSVLATIDRLVTASARANAVPVGIRTDEKMVAGTFLGMGWEQTVAAERFAKLVPSDTLESLKNGGALAAIYYSGFDSKDWVFIERAGLASVDAAVQESLFESLTRSGAVVVFEK